MKFLKFKFITVIAMCIVLGSNFIVAASTTKACKIINKDGVMDKLGISKEDFDKGLKEGRSLFDIAKEKGHSEEEVKKLIIEQKTNYIDSEVQKGDLSKEKGEEMKSKFKDRIEKWDGRFREHGRMDKNR